MPKPRLVIADDHILLAEAFEKLLAPECDTVGKVGDGRAMLQVIRELHPDVAVLDIAMPILNGIDASRQAKQIDPSIRLVFVTVSEDPELAAEAFRAGASAYLLKRSAGAELLGAIREVMKRRSYVTPLIAEGMVQALMDPSPSKMTHELTLRQREVLQLLAEGKSMKEAASILSVEPRTVAFHKYRMMDQLGIKTSAELILFAARQHLV